MDLSDSLKEFWVYEPEVELDKQCKGPGEDQCHMCIVAKPLANKDINLDLFLQNYV